MLYALMLSVMLRFVILYIIKLCTILLSVVMQSVVDPYKDAAKWQTSSSICCFIRWWLFDRPFVS
jgi:hypothetical protein